MKTNSRKATEQKGAVHSCGRRETDGNNKDKMLTHTKE